MKQLLFITLVLLINQSLNAQNILVVDNTISDPTEENYYSDLQSAITGAQSGDIIHLIPSTRNYGQINIVGKSDLTIIGAGYNAGAASTISPHDSRIIDIDIRNSSGIILKGLHITGADGINIGDVTDSESTNILIAESVITNLDIDRANGVTVFNCFIYSALTTSSSLSTNITISNSVIRVINFQQVNNTKLENSLVTGALIGGSVNDSIFTGNIFANNRTNSEGALWTDNNNTFINNFSTLLIDWEGGSNTGENNNYTDLALEAIFVDDSVRSDVDWSLDWSLEVDGAQFTGKGPSQGISPMDGTPIFSLPTIYEITVPNTLKAGEETEVTIKARGN